MATALAAVAGALIGLGLHFSGSGGQPTFALPAFHGQGDWGPGQRRAPGFTMRDQTGATVSLAAQRGQPVVIAFLDAQGIDGSGAEAASLSQAEAFIPRSRRPVLDVVSLDPTGDSPSRTRAAARRWGLKRPYHWLIGTSATISRLKREYGVDRGAAYPATTGSERPSRAGTPLYLVDRSGFERAGYLYPFFPTVLAGDLEKLYRVNG